MTGTITRIEPSGGLGRILVEEHPDDPYGGDKDFATVTPGTRILERTAEDTVPRAFGDLQVGKRVTVTFLGGVLASYPGQGTAGEITILRTRTDGPTPDPHAGTVTQTFRLSLFTAGDGVSPVTTSPSPTATPEVAGANASSAATTRARHSPARAVGPTRFGSRYRGAPN